MVNFSGFEGANVSLPARVVIPFCVLATSTTAMHPEDLTAERWKFDQRPVLNKSTLLSTNGIDFDHGRIESSGSILDASFEVSIQELFTEFTLRQIPPDPEVDRLWLEYGADYYLS